MTDPSIVELGAIAADIVPTVKSLNFTPETLSFAGPEEIGPAIHHWRLLLLFAEADDPSYLAIGAFADILTVRPDIADLDDHLSLALSLMDLPDRAEAFADLFADPDELAAALASGSATDTPGLIALIADVFVDPCLRGHDFALLLLWRLYEFTRELVDAAEVTAPAIIGFIPESTPAPVLSHWRSELNATLTETGLLILPAEIIPLATTDLLSKYRAAGYISVDTKELRQRMADGDSTLLPISIGRHPQEEDPDTDDDEAIDELTRVALMEAADSAGIAATANVYDPGLQAEVVTTLSFMACTGEDNDAASRPFIRAAEYLDDHPDVSVLSTNWKTCPCPAHGIHLVLELTVREGSPTYGSSAF